MIVVDSLCESVRIVNSENTVPVECQYSVCVQVGVADTVGEYTYLGTVGRGVGVMHRVDIPCDCDKKVLYGHYLGRVGIFPLLMLLAGLLACPMIMMWLQAVRQVVLRASLN